MDSLMSKDVYCFTSLLQLDGCPVGKSVGCDRISGHPRHHHDHYQLGRSQQGAGVSGGRTTVNTCQDWYLTHPFAATSDTLHQFFGWR